MEFSHSTPPSILSKLPARRRRQTRGVDLTKWKIAMCIFGLLGVAHGEPDSETDKPKEIRAAIAEKLKGEFKFAPKPPPDHPATDAEVTVLPAFEILGSRKNENLYRALRDEKEKRDEEKFSWTKGGTILKRGNVSVMFKYDPTIRSFKILNYSF